MSSENDNNGAGHATVLLPDASFLLFGELTRVGFDLHITNPGGEVFIVHDYFWFDPPPHLVIESGAMLTPQMVDALMPDGLEGVMFAGPATSGAVLEEIGTIRFVRGDVTIERADGTIVQASRGDRVHKGDIIKTGDGSFINIRFDDGAGAKSTRFNLGSNAEATLNDFQHEPDNNIGKFDVSVRAGGFKFKSGGIGDFGTANKHTTIRTPSAVIGVRGSELEGTVDPVTGATLIVHRSGILDVADANGENQTTLDSPGETSFVTLGGSPTFSPQPSQQQQQTLEENLPPPQSEQVDDQIDQQETPDDTGDEGEGQEEGDSQGDEGDGGEDAGDQEAPEAGEAGEGEEGADDESSGEENTDDADADEGDGEEGEEPTDENAEGEEGDTGEPGDETSGEQDDDDENIGAAAGSDEGDGDAPDQNQGDAGDDAGTGDNTGDGGDGTTDDGGSGFGDDGNPLDDVTGDDGGDTGTGDTGTGDTGADGGDAGDTGDATTGGDGTNTGDDPGADDTPPANEPEIPPNVAPIAAQDAFTLEEDTTVTGNVLDNDVDPDSNVFSANPTPLSAPANGSLTLASDGTFSYTPDTDFVGTDTFTYQVQDAVGGVDTATVTFTVTPVNDAPTAVDDTINATEDEPLVFSSATLLANDTDADGDALTLTSAGQPANGSLQLSTDGSFTYIPDANFAGLDSFDYVITDATGETAVGTVTLSVSGVNDAPVAADDAATTDQNTFITLGPAEGVLANDADIDSNSLAVVEVAGQSSAVGVTLEFANGAQVQINASGAWAFEPNGGFDDLSAGESESVSVSYTVGDGEGGEDDGLLTLTVTGVNDAPVAEADEFETGEDQQLTSSSGLLANDSDPDASDAGLLRIAAVNGDAENVSVRTPDGTSTEVRAVTLNSGATLVVYDDGSLRYQPGSQFDALGEGDSAVDSFTYTVVDSTGLTATQSAQVRVLGTNDAPAAITDVFQVDVGESLTGANFLANDVDAEGDPILFDTASVSNPANGTLTVDANGDFSYTPDAGFSGTDSFTYEIADGNGGSDEGEVKIIVGEPNTAPVAADDQYFTQPGSVLEIEASQGLLANDTDADGDSLTVSTTPVEGPVNGSLTLSDDGAFVYTPDAGFSGTDSFTYEISDGRGGTAQATVTLPVSAVNNAPIAQADSAQADEDTVLTVDAAAGVLANDSDPEGGAISVVSVFGQANSVGSDVGIGNGATIRIDADGSFKFDPNGAFDSLAAGETSTVDVDYAIADPDGGTAASVLTIVVTGTNDGPEASNDDYQVFNAPLVVSATDGVLANDLDVDGDALTVSLLQDVSNGTLSLDADGAFTYTPTTGFFGSDSFGYQITDPGGETSTASVFINVLQSAPPSAVDDGYLVAKDGTLTVGDAAGLLANDSDPDGDPLTAALETDVSHGSLSLDANGAFTYTPTAGFTGTDSFTYRVSDGNGGESTATVILQVQDNDAPVVAGPVTAALTEDAAATTIDLLANATDADGDTLTVTGVDVTGDTAGTALSGSIVTVDPAAYSGLGAGETETITYSFDVFDGIASTPGSAIVTIAGVNDAPLAGDDTATTNVDVDLSGTLAGVASDPDANDSLTFELDTDGSNGTATVDANGDYLYAPSSGFIGTDSFSYRVTDEAGATAVGTITVEVTSSPIEAVGDIYNTDEDTALSVDAANGVLADDIGQGLAASLVTSSSGGTVSLNPDGSFDFSPANNFSGLFNFVYQITDASNQTDTASVTISVSGVNDAPNAIADSFNMSEDGVLDVTASGGLLLNDSDVDGDSLTVITTPVSGPSHGTVSLSSNGAFIYTPDAGYDGTDTFTYQVSDGALNDSAVVTINIANINNQPVNTVPVSPVAATEDTPVSIPGISATDSDGTITSMTISAVGGAFTTSFVAGSSVDGTETNILTITGSETAIMSRVATLGYMPPFDFAGTAIITVRSQDNEGGQSTDTFQVQVAGTNDAPIAVPDNFDTAGEDEPITFDVLANDIDADGDTLTILQIDGQAITAGGASITLTNGTGAGTIALNADGRTVEFQPGANYTGGIAFTYEVTDGVANSTGTFFGTILPEVDAPVVTGVPDQVVSEDGTFTFSSTSAITVADVDGDLASVLVSATNGVLTASPQGGAAISGNLTNAMLVTGPQADIISTLAVVQYQPDTDFTGTDTVFVQAVDDFALTDTTAIGITVTNVNDAPTITANTTDTATEDVPELIPLSVADVDAGDVLTLTVSTFYTPLSATADTDGDAYTVTLTGTAAQINTDLADLTFSATPDFTTTSTTVDVVLTDGTATTSTSILYNITPVNDPPSITVPGAQTVDEDMALDFTSTKTISASDVDGSITSINILAANGDLSVSGPATISGNFTSNVTLTGTEGDILSTLGTLSYQGFFNYNGSDTISVTAQDDGAETSTATISITVNPVNDPPFGISHTETATEDMALMGDLNSGVIDDDGDMLTFNTTPISAPSHGSIVINTDGTFTYTPDPDSTNSDSVIFEFTDGSATGTGTLQIFVTAQPDAPVNNVPASVMPVEDTAFSFTAGDAVSVDDPDGDLSAVVLSVSSGTLTVTGPASISGSGTASVSISGSQADINTTLSNLSYLGSSNFDGTDTLMITSVDSTSSVTDSITLNVQSDNDAPTGDITINGLAIVGLTLTADPSSIADVDGLPGDPTTDTTNFSFQWFRDGSPISGATDITYTVQAADLLAELTVNITYFDNDGFPNTVFSGTGTAPVDDTAIFDNGNGDGIWGVPSNWAAGNLPTSTQDVTITSFMVDHISGSSSVASVLLEDSADLTISGGDLTVNGPANSTIDSSSALHVTDGTLTATNTFDVLGTLEIGGSTSFIKTIDNAGTVFLDEGTGSFANSLFSADAVINQSGAFFYLDHSGTGDHAASLIQNVSPFQNSGTVRTMDTNGGMSASTYHLINGGFDNLAGGLLWVDGGNLQIDNGNLDFSAGTVEVASGKELLLTNSTITWGGALQGTGTISTSGTNTFGAAVTLDNTTPGFDLSGGIATFTGASTLTIGTTQTLASDGDAINNPLVVDAGGTYQATAAGNTIGGSLGVNASGTLELLAGAANVDLTVATGFTSLGDIVLDQINTSSTDARLTITSGVLVNNGMFEVMNTGGGVNPNHEFTGDMNGTGAVNLTDANLLLKSGSSLDVQNGSLDIDPTSVLRLESASTLTLTGGANFTGTGSIETVSGTTTITIPTSLTFNASSPSFDLDQSTTIFNGSGPLTLASGKTLNLHTNDTVSVPLVNNGTLEVRGTNNSVTGGLTQNSGAAIELLSENVDAELTISAGFTNDGTVLLDQLNTNSTNAILTVGSGVLTNNFEFKTANTGGGVMPNHEFTGDLDGTGTFNLDANLILKSGSSLDVQNGSLDIAPGAALRLEAGSSLTLTGGANFSGTGSIETVSGTTTITIPTTLTFEAASPSFDLDQSQTSFNGTGPLTLATGKVLNLHTADALNVPLVNNGTLEIRGTANLVNGAVTQNGTGAINVLADASNAVVTIANGFTNDGMILLDQVTTSSTDARLTVTTGTLVNDGTFQTANTNGGALPDHEFNGQMSGSGMVDLDANLILKTGGSLDVQNGSLDIASGAILKVENGASLTLTGGANFAGGGVIQTTSGTTTITIPTSLTMEAASPVFDLGLSATTFNGTGPLTIGIGKVFNLDTNDTVAVPLISNGVVEVRGAGNDISGALTINPIGKLNLIADGSPASLSIANSFTNAGKILLDQDAGSSADANLTVSGTLTNTGEFVVRNTGGSGGVLHTFDGDFAGHGVLDVDSSFQFVANSTLDASTATVDIAHMQVLELVGFSGGGVVLTLDSDSQLKGGGTLEIGGTSTVTMTSALSLQATAPAFDLSGNVTFSGAGLTVGNGYQFDLATNDAVTAPLQNQGTIVVTGTNNSISGALTQNSSGVIAVDAGAVAADLTIASGFTNFGRIELDQTAGSSTDASLTVTSGVLVNDGVIQTDNSSDGPSVIHVLSGDFGGTGTFDFEADTQLAAGSLLDISSASLRLPGSILTIDSSTLGLGTLTELDGTGTIAFTGTSDINLVNDTVISAGGPTFDLSGGTVTVTATNTQSLTLTSVGSLTLSSADTIAVDTFNDGVITARGTANAITGALSLSSNGIVEVMADSSTGAGALNINGNFTTTGTFILDELSTTSNAAALTFNGGTGILNTSGDFYSLASFGGNKVNVLNATISNQGYFEIGQNLAINSAGAHQNNGSMQIDSGETLSVAGASFLNSATGFISGGGTLNVSGTSFTNSGTLDPGTDTTIGTLTITGNVVQNNTAVTVIDIASLVSHDAISVTGNYDFVGTYDLYFDQNPGTGSFDIITATNVFPTMTQTVSHDLAAGYDVSISNTTGTVTVTVSTGFEFLSNFAGAWEDTSTTSTTVWIQTPALPTLSDDVLITHAMTSGAVNTAKSMSIETGGSLQVLDNSLTLASNSRVDAGTSLTLNSNSMGNGSLQTDGILTVDGQFVWNNKLLSGSGGVVVNGSATVNIGDSTTLTTTLDIFGTASINAGSTTSLGGAGAINNYGALDIVGGINVAPTVMNAEGGTLSILDGGVDATSTITQNFTNAGQLVVDNTDVSPWDVKLSFGGTALNEGTITFSNTGGGGGLRTISTTGNFTNNGTIDVNYDAVLDMASQTLDSTGGTIDIAATRTLGLDGGVTFIVGPGTQFLGSGTLEFLGATTLDLFGDVSFGSLAVTGNGAQATTITSTTSVTLTNEGSFELDTSDTVAAVVGSITREHLISPTATFSFRAVLRIRVALR